jgi:hypothetical protein
LLPTDFCCRPSVQLLYGERAGCGAFAFEGFEYSSRNIVFGCKARELQPIVERAAIIGGKFPWDCIQLRKIPVNSTKAASPASLYEEYGGCQLRPVESEFGMGTTSGAGRRWQVQLGLRPRRYHPQHAASQPDPQAALRWRCRHCGAVSRRPQAGQAHRPRRAADHAGRGAAVAV